MEKPVEIRIDKFLWSVRLYKTRSLATDACKKGWVLINNNTVKPSRNVNTNEIIFVKSEFIFRQYKVIQVLNNRVSAKLIENYINEITPEEELFKLKIVKELDPFGKVKRENGTGRPTKKERRDLEDYFE
jgi:ribosome-associated heat shock protein Hsp15